LAENIALGWQSARTSFGDAAPVDNAVTHLVALLSNVPARLHAGEPGLRDEILASANDISGPVSSEIARLNILEQEAARSARERAKTGKAQDPLVPEFSDSDRQRLRELRRLSWQLNELKEHFEGSPGALLVKRLCLLTGEWGTGKTHFVCDFTKHRIEEGRPILLLLAKNFQNRREILNTLAEATKIAPYINELLDRLNMLGAARQERVLLIVDGVNEGPRAPWRRAIDELVDLVENLQHIALVVSCRSSFENHSFSDSVLPRFEKIVHHGFDEQEFDAQAEFFSYYKLSLPEVPLLDDEFSRPLTLKLICNAFSGLGTKKLKKGFHGVASGQKGMTYVLESFVNGIAGPIEKRFGLPRRACWELLKGRSGLAGPYETGFAGYMAVTLRHYVGTRAAHRIVRAQIPLLSYRKRRALLEKMRTSGLLDEDSVWISSEGARKRMPVLRLPYQRFSDHLIARYLLERYLNKSNEHTLRKSFDLRSPLGRVFRRDRRNYTYARPGWAEALIVEFPEAAKRVAQGNRELYFFLPRRAQNLNYYYMPLVQGLFWRAPTSFSSGTDRVVGTLLEGGNEHAWRKTVDALVAISIKPGHPYSAKRLFGYLARDSMSVRDRTWTEYIRQHYESPSIVRLLTWAEHVGSLPLRTGIADQVIVLLSLVLTTVVRRDRDVATRALVELGERRPRSLFTHTVKALEFSDPYVPERMLAASYAVALSKQASAEPRFQNALCKLAHTLYQEIFALDAARSTHHTLLRDYALGVVRVALSVRPNLLSARERMHLDAPFPQMPSPFPNADAITDEQIAEVDGTIRMDFGNYTIGRLLPNRNNYDFENAEYKTVRRQIEWRIWNLGYRKADFDLIEQRPYYMEHNAERKVDRYGKKYSWIAFFEMYGLREAHRLLDEDRLKERTSDCDIDPTFPKRPPAWTPPLPPMFGDKVTGSTAWVAGGFTPDFQPLLRLSQIDGKAGPWVLLQGFVLRQEKALDREIFTFLRGLFVHTREVGTLRERFLTIEYPGNNKIPDGPADHYVFAAEAGSSPRFAPELRVRDGRYRRYVGEAFYATERIAPPPEALPNQVAGGPFPPDLRMSRKIPGIRVELPDRSFSWESYHSAINDFSGFLIPSASIISALKLCTWNREVDFRDPTGKLATLYREERGKNWHDDSDKFLYIREDCLRSYLRKTRQTLVWCNWGERSWADKQDLIPGLSPEKTAVLRLHAHVHRRFHEYDEL